MTQWKVTWTKGAKNYYRRMGRNYQQKVQEAVRALKEDPFTSKNVKRLKGELEGLCRYCVGKVRMVFRVLEGTGEIRIIAIASRGDIYK